MFLMSVLFGYGQVMSLNGVSLTASGGAPSNCTAGGYKTLNSAGVAGSCVTFTTGSFQNGAIWACSGINLNQSFKLTFTANFGTNAASGDGMAFLLQTEGVPQVIGGRGGGLGYAQGDGGGCQGGTCPITPSVAVEFDTWDNSPAGSGGLNDIAADHTSIQTNGIMTAGNTLSGPISCLTSGASIRDGANHTICITWDPALNRYIVYFDGVLRMQYNGNIRTAFADPTNVYWGFTGASGGGAQTQSVCSASLLTNIASPSCSCTAPVATATPNPQTICSGNPTGVSLSSSVGGTTFAWSTTANANITGETTSGGSGSTITDVLTNTTNTTQSVTYTVTPTASGCVGTAITVPVTVNPAPAITAMTNTVCSGVAFSSTPANGTNGVVPAGTTYSWSAPTVSGGLTGGASGTNQSSIGGTLTNPTNTAQTATYIVTPTAGSCAGATFTVTVTVNTRPAINPMTAATCSGIAFNSTPVNATNGVVPAGTTYSWSAPTVTGGLTGGASGTNQSSIGGTLTNPTNTAQTATYTVTPTSGSCSGSSFVLTVTVNPVPPVPTVSTTAPTCLVSGTSTITNYNGALTYVFAPSGPSVGALGSISGMTAGTNYTVTASNGICTSGLSLPFSIAAQLTVPSVPTVSTTAPTCSSSGTATITNYNGALTYVFLPAGPTAGALGVISGMTAGTNYTVEASNGSCSSGVSSSFSIAAQLIVPSVPTINTVAPTCLVSGMSMITNYNGALTYEFAPSGPSVGALGSISGMTAGTNYTVTASNETCTSTASATFSIAAQFIVPSAPLAGTDSTYCSNWIIAEMTVSGTGGTYTWYTDPMLTLSSEFGTGSSIMPANTIGTITYYVTETLNGCEGLASSVTITIQDCEIIVPTAFTPDNDGINDVWEIVDLDEVYPNNIVTVFNRWGNVVYQSEEGNYGGIPWDGTYIGNPLPVASYYFVIDFNEPEITPRTGTVSILLNN
jgi:gliding motility-associated-like protein